MNTHDFAMSPLLDVESPLPDSGFASLELPEVLPRPISKRRGKKRSSRACTTCRSRKVRCNIVAHGAPCSNCRHDEIDCVLPLSRRQRSARERAEQALRSNSAVSVNGSESKQNRAESTEMARCGSQHHNERSVTISQDRHCERSQSRELLGPHGMDITEHVLAEIIPIPSMFPKDEKPSIPPTSSRTRSWIQVQSPLASAPKETRAHTLPPVFVPLPRHLNPADISYLQSRGALTLPTESLQVDLLKAYVEYVHPSMPLLDLEEFLSSVKYGNDTLNSQRGRAVEKENALKRRTPLLLFQAVMFAGVAYVPLRSLKDAGFKSREAAKQTFFARVRLCYDFDTCTDRQTIIQALLLMTLCPSSPHENKDAYHWLGLAISLAYSLGLNRSTTPQQLSIREKRLQRRIWWIIFIRDRTLALDARGTMARPIRIRTDDCTVNLLCLADFDLSEDVDDIEDESGDRMRERQTALRIIWEAKMCWCSNNTSLTNFNASYTMPIIAVPATAPAVLEQDHIMEDHAFDCLSYESPAFFEGSEESGDHLTQSSPSTSLHDEVTTPQAQQESVIVQSFEQAVVRSEDVGDSFGVDGEYDDYLEFLKPTGESLAASQSEKNKSRDSWAFQFDCENDRVLVL